MATGNMATVMLDSFDDLDYVVGELSRSTNEKHAEEREECLTRLSVVREVAVLTISETPELKEGYTRHVFKTKESMLAGVKHFYDFTFVLRLTKAGYEIDVKTVTP